MSEFESVEAERLYNEGRQQKQLYLIEEVQNKGYDTAEFA